MNNNNKSNKENGESEREGRERKFVANPSPAFMAPVWVFAKRRRIRIMAIDAYGWICMYVYIYIYMSISRQTST